MLPSIASSKTLPRSRYIGWLQDYLGIDEAHESRLLDQTEEAILEQWVAVDPLTGVTWHAAVCPYLVFRFAYPLAEPAFLPGMAFGQGH